MFAFCRGVCTVPTLQAPNLDLFNVIQTFKFVFKIMKCKQIIQTVRRAQSDCQFFR